MYQKPVPKDSLCYVLYRACKIELNKCVGKFHSQMFEFDFRFPPFSDFWCYIFPFRKPQVVFKIGKEITAGE
jgi:hypothetical protein